MFNALFSSLRNNYWRMLLIFLFSMLAVLQLKAQPPPPDPNQPLRVSIYNDEFILGYAPAGSVIKLYYGTATSPCEKRAGSIPFVTLMADENNSWAYSSKTNTLEVFLGPVVVYYIKPGTTEEVIESSIIGLDEIRVSQNACMGTAVLSMPYFSDFDAMIWKDLSGGNVATGNYVTLPAGTYTMEYQNRNGCLYKSQSVTVFDAAPVAQGQTVTIPCGGQTAAVEGKFSGSASTFLWEKQSDGSKVTDTRVAILPPGAYYFSAIANGGCLSNKVAVVVNAAPPSPVIDISRKDVHDADCGSSNGHIIGINATVTGNAALTYIWTNSKGDEFKVKDLTNIPPETYTLHVSAAGSTCVVSSLPIEIVETNGIRLNVTSYHAAESATTCGENNGKITGFTSENANVFKWYKGQDRTTPVSNTIDLLNVAPEYYTIVLSNTNTDCTYSQTFHVAAGSPAIVVAEEPLITPDDCGLGIGSITGIRLNTSIKKYTWLDVNQNEVGHDADLRGVGAGVYTLLAESDKCQNSFTYTVPGTSTSITAPLMEDILVCAASTVLGSFKETSPIYRIYDADGVMISERNDKDFGIKVTQPGMYYAALANGDCESPRVPFTISFGSSGVEIPSAFSPNGDGQNDKWIIKGIDRYLTPDVKVFNRQGVVVFHTNGRAQPFDGKEKGADLPVGVYYYLVKASAECPALSGSLMLIR